MNILKNDLPGPAKFKAVCKECGIIVRDKKEVCRVGRVYAGPVQKKPIFKKEKSVISQNSRVNII